IHAIEKTAALWSRGQSPLVIRASNTSLSRRMNRPAFRNAKCSICRTASEANTESLSDFGQCGLNSTMSESWLKPWGSHVYHIWLYFRSPHTLEGHVLESI